MEQSEEGGVFPELTCPRLKKARMICISPKCGNCSFICFEDDCLLCEQSHTTCQYYRVHSLLKRVKSKRQQISPEIESAIKAMETIYDEAIDRLSDDKNSLRDQMELFGYNEFEAKFIKMILDGEALQVKGNLSAEVMNNLSTQCEFLATEEAITKYWRSKKVAFTQLFDNFKKIARRKYQKLESKIIDDCFDIQSFFAKPVLEFKLLYRASEHNYAVSVFHQKCDGIVNTMVLARTEYGKIIGGYNAQAWNSSSAYANDVQSKNFLFSVTNNERYDVINASNATYNQAGYGPTFGGGHDFYIANNSHNTTNTSYFKLGTSYKTPKGLTGTQALTAFSGNPSGQMYAKVTQWEVFEITF